MALTEKQKRFCNEYLVDLNATQAAIRAGYSEKTANRIASENLSKLDIQEYIKNLMDSKQSDLIASQDEVLQTLTAIMRREKKEIIVASERTRKSYYDKNGKKCIDETEVPVCVPIDTKISDVNKAAELLGKRYGLFTDKVKVDGSTKVVIVDDLNE